MKSDIHPTAVIYPNVTIGEGVYIGPLCIIGAPPENLKTWPDAGKGVYIGDGARLTGGVTIDAGVERQTWIGERAFIMKGVHVGHDSILGKDCVLAAHCSLAGYVVLGDGCYLGMGVIVRNRKVVPHDVEVGMGAIVTRSCDLWPGGIFIGAPAAFLRWKEDRI